MSGKFKLMHFTSSNLLHNFPSSKYMSFFFYIKKFIVKNSKPDPPICHGQLNGLRGPRTLLREAKFNFIGLYF